MKKIEITEDVEINWYRDYGVNALNLHSLVFEMVSDFCGDDKYCIHLVEYDNESEIDEFKVSDELNSKRFYDYNVDYALYSKDGCYLCGFVSKNY